MQGRIALSLMSTMTSTFSPARSSPRLTLGQNCRYILAFLDFDPIGSSLSLRKVIELRMDGPDHSLLG